MNSKSKAKNPRKPAWMIRAEYYLDFARKIGNSLRPIWVLIGAGAGFSWVKRLLEFPVV